MPDLAVKLLRHIAQLLGVVNIVLEHIAQHGHRLLASVRMVMLAVMGMLMGVGIDLAVFVGVGVLMDGLAQAVVGAIPQIASVCKE